MDAPFRKYIKEWTDFFDENFKSGLVNKNWNRFI